MRILYHHRTMADGAEAIHIREMILAFRKLGHSVTEVGLRSVFSPEPRVNHERLGAPSPPGNGLPSLRQWTPRWAYETAELAYNVVGKGKLRRLVRSEHPDLIYDRYNTFCNAAVEIGNRFKIPVFLEVNAPLAYERTNHDRGLFFADKAMRYEGEVCRSADHVFAVSTPLKDYLVDQHSVAESNIMVLPNGADPDVFSRERSVSSASAVRRRLGISEDALVIGFSGILRPWHGLDLLCQAFATLAASDPRLVLLIVGDGPSESEVRSRIDQSGLSHRAFFTGRLPHDAVRDHVAVMDIAVSPRATFYASPMKILEYMALEVPVVAPDMTNIRDLLDDGVDGVLFEPEQTASLTQRLATLVVDSDLRKSLGQAGRAKVVTTLNWQRNAERVLDLFDRVTVGLTAR